jgi:outer membrane protein assembly factor BamE (lipoprotein component of BamABCDE complex)
MSSNASWKSLAAMAGAAVLAAACASGGFAQPVPARSDQLFAQVHTGMDQAEIAHMLGAPDQTMRFPLSSNEAWDYRYQDRWGYIAIYSVTFGPDGRVASTISNRINSGGDHGSSK